MNDDINQEDIESMARMQSIADEIYAICGRESLRGDEGYAEVSVGLGLAWARLLISTSDHPDALAIGLEIIQRQMAGYVQLELAKRRIN